MAVGSATVQAIYGISSVSSLVLAYIVWGHRDKTAAKPLLLAIIAGWWWATALFLSTVAANPTVSAWLVRSVFLGVTGTVVAVFLLALEYTGRTHLINRRTIALLLIEPVIVVALAFTPSSDLLIQSIESVPGSPTGVQVEYGIAFLGHTVYSYLMTIAVGGLILDLAHRTRALYRGQLAVLLLAVSMPLLANFVAVLGLVTFDSTPVGIIIANACFTIAITRYRLIDLVPIARDRVVSNIRDAVFVVDTEDRIVDVNPAAEDLAEEFVGEVDLIGEDARELLALVPDIDTIYDEIVTANEPRTVEYAIGGGHYQVEATPINDDRGRAVGWLFIIRDITEQQRREQQLRERNEQLDKFASVVSHDLRNPLQVANGRVELARETGDVSHLEAVETAHNRMEAIIEDVLSLARSGDTATDLAPIALDPAVRDAWAGVETTGAALHVAADVRITADSDRLARLLENLFRNAIEHGADHEAPADGPRILQDSAGTTADGGPVPSDAPADADPTVTVDVGLVREGGTPVGFYVADDGPGIPPDEREQVFESGYSTGEEGTGFGLTIVSQIGQAHGWSVAVTDSESGGARFEVTDVEVVGG
jgi:PAS domain S-box-containing protein